MIDERNEMGATGPEDDEAGRKGRRRSKTMSRKELARQMRRERAQGADPELEQALGEVDRMRPQSRSECVNSERPCMFVSCKYHLYLDVNPETGSIKLNFPDLELWELEETCALDVADKGGITLEEVGVIMNLTRERIRQVEMRGLEKIKDVCDPEDPGPPPVRS